MWDLSFQSEICACVTCVFIESLLNGNSLQVLTVRLMLSEH